LKIIDFDRNAYQLGIFLKFPYISGDKVAETVQQLVGERKIFRSVLKGEGQAPLTLSVGEGTQAAPLFQMKIGPDTLSLFGGWFVVHDDWVKWRNSLVPMLAQILQRIPNDLVLGFFNQCSSPIPTDRVKRLAEIPEMKLFEDFFQRIVPAENRERGNSYVSFSDAESKRFVEWYFGGWAGFAPIPGYENVVFNTRLNILERDTDLRKALETHVIWADSLLEKFHSNYLSLLIKP